MSWIQTLLLSPCELNTSNNISLEDINMNYEDQNEILEGFLEVELKKSDDFLRVRETLTRIGLTARDKNELIQTCHILHKQGQYYLCGFGELFSLDGKPYEFTEEDEQRRNRIAHLLQEWGLLSIKNPEKYTNMIPMNRLKIIPFRDKDNWTLRSNYTLGSRNKQ